jgi:hypothetical protein
MIKVGHLIGRFVFCNSLITKMTSNLDIAAALYNVECNQIIILFLLDMLFRWYTKHMIIISSLYRKEIIKNMNKFTFLAYK